MPLTDAQRIEALEDRVAILEDALGLTYEAPLDYGLSRFQSQVLGVIASAPVATYDRLMTALYGDRADPPDVNTIKTVMCHIRQRLESHGIPVKINTLWGVGYSMSEAHRAHVKQRLAA